jgi:signal transduction histidine kinase
MLHPTRRETRGGDSLLLNSLWGGLRVFRLLAIGYAAWGAVVRLPEMAHPAVALGIIALLGVWSVWLAFVDRRDLALHLAEFVLVSAAVLSTRWVDSPQAAVEGQTTVVGVYQAVPIVSLALIAGWRGGLAASLLMTAVLLAVVGRVDSEPLSNAGLLVMLGTCIGYVADVARTEQAALRRALARQAEIAERDRLARTVHDGVLQALAFIHRRGLDLGGDAARLGVIAAQQEHQLRALASGIPLRELEATVDGPADLRYALEAASTGTAVLVAPHEPVELEPRVVREIVAAVEAALDNVRKHAGPDARSWVLVDDLGGDVVVTVRDNGVGVSPERMAQAGASGRLGVSSSIKSRIEDLGGRATYLFGPGGGTTVEMWIPKEAG